MTREKTIMTQKSKFKKIASKLFGLPFICIGVMHFVTPEIFVPLVPSAIGVPMFWVLLSGIFEVGVGIGICFNKTQRAAYGILILMLIVLYTANINMWVNDIPFNGQQMSNKGHMLRGVIQAVMILLSVWFGEFWPFLKAPSAQNDIS
jgi:uncharacterized membrane protein